jgi:hypothetical protein
MNIANDKASFAIGVLNNLSPHKDVEYADCVQQYFQREK